MAENKTADAAAIIEQAEIVTNYAQAILDEITILIATAKGDTDEANRIRSIVDAYTEQDVRDAYTDGFSCGIEAQRAAREQWIPVTERLPEPTVNPVLVSHIGTVCLAWRYRDSWVLPSGIKTFEATHWMPLPEPPKMNGNADWKCPAAT